MKTFINTFGLAVALAFFVAFAGQARAQDQQNADMNASQNADLSASQNTDMNVPQNDMNNAPPSDQNTAPQTDQNASFQMFYDQLSSQGTWIQTEKYGYVWQPTESDPNWRPYTYGHWVNTDAGMTWASDEPFGWATYHYGRWVNLDGEGWVWVPGYTWAPAWVSWRDSDDYVGWAPLPPDTFVGVDFFDPGLFFGFGFHIGDDCDLAFGIGPWCYNFCPVAFFGDPYCWRHFADRRDNFALIGRTRNITNLNVSNDRRAGVFNRVRANGPSSAVLARSTTPVQQARLTRASSLAGAGLHGKTLAAFAPKIDPATAKTARPASVGRTLANTSVNRGTSINHPMAVNSNIKPASATASQIHAASLAQSRMSSNAKVATANTSPSRPLTRSLTSLQSTPNLSGAKSNTAVGGGMKPGAVGGANAGVPATAMGGASHRTTTQSSAQSSLTGAPATRNTTTPSRSAESTFTGAPTTRHTLAPSSAQSSFTGAPTTRHTIAPSRSAEATYTGAPTTRHTLAPSSPQSSYTGAPTTRHTFTPSSSGGSVYHPQSSAPVYHSSASVYHSQSSAPVYHQSAPAYHPQSSFHSYAPPQSSFRSAAPATHFSGGSFGGGRPSGGGGGSFGGGGGGHVSSGGGQGGGGQHH